jgi:hypothetical protein
MRFKGSVPGGADKADVGLSFVVPQVKLILGDLARSEKRLCFPFYGSR